VKQLEEAKADATGNKKKEKALKAYKQQIVHIRCSSAEEVELRIHRAVVKSES
jgi:hypothetical protein